ncbi:phosphatase PAP2 family protein [Agromyces sp. SYSU K20354]|uniref:phosphatase PAP2 family protein n=1 Tax=Agromyces cavernae TaxID=2898659 RepID=UPI001E3A64AF|nr:phosphatase PAP2 family protein [Agromyces cavernae]MCD2442059.1 phosphatase PAP2 family protein [Agromyces cavernae]
MTDATSATVPSSSGPLGADAGDASARPMRPRALLVAGLAGLAVFIGFGFAVAQNVDAPFTQPIDDAWRALVGLAPGTGGETWALPMLFQHLGQIPGAVLTMLLIPAWLFVIRRWRSALFFLTAELVGNFGVSQLTKNLVDRPRPADDTAAGLFGPLFQVDHGSFPSGHAVSTGILVIAVAALLPPAKRLSWWIIGALLVVGMIWQRTLINAHWLSDALFGIIGGASATLIIWWAFATLLQKDYGKPLFRRAIAAPANEGAA